MEIRQIAGGAGIFPREKSAISDSSDLPVDTYMAGASSCATGLEANLRRLQAEVLWGSSRSASVIGESLEDLDKSGSASASLTAGEQARLHCEVAIARADLFAVRTSAGIARWSPDKVSGVTPEMEKILAELDKARLMAGKEGVESFPYKGLLQAARTQISVRKLQAQCALGEISQDEKDSKIQELLRFERGMDYQAIRALLRLVLDSPGDRFSFAVDAKAGAAAEIPFFGRAELFVKGRAAFDADIDSTGQFQVSFDARLSGGAGASLPLAKCEASGEFGGYHKISYVFPNEDEASRFIQSLMHRLRITDAPSEFNPPIPKHHQGNFLELNAKLGPVSFMGKRQDEESTAAFPMPWLPRNHRLYVKTRMIRDTVSTTLDFPKGTLGLKIWADDVAESRSLASTGTTLRMDFKLGAGVSGSCTAREAFIDSLYGLIRKGHPHLLDKIPGASKLGEAELKSAFSSRIGDIFSDSKVSGKASGSGSFQYTVYTPRSLFIGERKTVLDALVDFIGHSLEGGSENKWELQSARAARELSLAGKVRLQSAPGAHLFAELGFSAEHKDSTTLRGSLLHARAMLYNNLPGTSYSEMQQKELAKDGLLTAYGTLDKNAFVVTLGKMRNELFSMHGDPSWQKGRGNNISLSDFSTNVDSFLGEITRSMWDGLTRTGHCKESLAEFESSVSPAKIREVDSFITYQGLQNAPLEDVLEMYESLASGKCMA